MKTSIIRNIARVFLALFATAILANGAPERVTVGHDLWIGYSGIFIAKDKGFFEKAGLAVEFKPFSNPGDTLPALVGGKLDIALTTLQNLALLNGKSEASLVGVYLIDSSNGADAIVAKKEIATVAGLKGKKVGATIGEVNHMLLLAGLEKAGLKESDIQLMNLSADDAGAAFVAGTLDAAVTWEPWVSKATSSDGKVIFSSAEIPDTILDAVVVPKSAVEGRSADLKAFIGAIDEGVKFLKENPAEGRAIIAKYLGVKPEEVKGMLEGDKIYSLTDNAKLLAPGGPGYASMARVIDFAAAQKLIETPLKPDAQFAPQFVQP